MSALLVFLNSLPEPQWIAFGIAVGLSAALVIWELRASQPFLDIHLLASNLALTRTYLRFGLISLTGYTVLYGLTQWMESAHGFSARTAGLLLLPMSILSAIVVRPISTRNLVRGPLIAAAVSSAIGSVGVLFLTGDTATGLIVLVTLVFGITMGTYASSTRPRSTPRQADQTSRQPPACCAHSAMSGPSLRQPSSASSSTRASAITGYTPSPLS